MKTRLESPTFALAMTLSMRTVDYFATFLRMERVKRFAIHRKRHLASTYSVDICC